MLKALAVRGCHKPGFVLKWRHLGSLLQIERQR